MRMRRQAGTGALGPLPLPTSRMPSALRVQGWRRLNSDDDVSEIWVASGMYKPTSTTDRTASFSLVNNTALYGGFTGVETKLSQRNPDPLINNTVLSGDLLNNDDQF